MDAKELGKLELSRWLIAVYTDWLIIAMSFYMAYRINQWWVYIIAAFVIATRQHALAIMGHDGAHYLACKNRKINDLLTNIFCFWPFMLSVEGYRDFHFQHHRALGTSDDPELDARKGQAPLWDLPKKRLDILRECIKDMLGLRAHYFYHIYYYLTFKRNLSWQAILSPLIFSGLLLLICIFLKQYWIPILWFASLATFFQMIFNLRTWTEHIGIGETHRLEAPLWQEWIYLPHKTWLHWEHHKYPYVPCWKLKEVQKFHSEVPIISITQLFEFFETSKKIDSGELPE